MAILNTVTVLLVLNVPKPRNGKKIVPTLQVSRDQLLFVCTNQKIPPVFEFSDWSSTANQKIRSRIAATPRLAPAPSGGAGARLGVAAIRERIF